MELSSVWDKKNIYGYSDEVMLARRPADNEIAKEGCAEVLTREEVYRMFPNQIVIVEICDYDKLPQYWNAGKVLWYQCSLDYAFDYILKNDSSGLMTFEHTYSAEVRELLDR